MHGVVVADRNVVGLVAELEIPEEALFDFCDTGAVGALGVKLGLGRIGRVKHRSYIDSTNAKGRLLRHPRSCQDRLQRIDQAGLSQAGPGTQLSSQKHHPDKNADK